MLTPKYTKPSDLEALLTPRQQAALTDDDPMGENGDVFAPSGNAQIDSDMVNTFLAFSEATAESYVQGRYPVPLMTRDARGRPTTEYGAPPAFLYAVLAIARHRLLARRGLSSEEVTADYTDALAWLQRVQDDDVDLYARDEDDPMDTDVRYGVSHNRVFDSTFFVT